MSSILLLIISLIMGVALQRVKTIPSNAHSTLGTLILYVPLPAICLLTVPDLRWRIDLLSLVLVAWIMFAFAYLFFTYLGRKFSWEKPLIGALILNAGFANTAFMGFPIIEALYGTESLKHAVLLDQAGSFLIVSTLGILIALNYSSGMMKKRVLFQKILIFPPFVGFITGLLMGSMDLRVEGDLRTVLEKLAGTLTPMALISVGLQLKWGEIRGELRYLVLGLGFKLFMAPLLIFILYYFAGVKKEIFKVAVMESAMAPMITASILAGAHNLRPKLSGLMVGVGVPLSLLTLALWYFVIEFFN